MARPKNSPEKIERMRNDMMDAVINLLDDVSPDKVSIRMIAEKIGVSHMVFYTYFGDRSEIMKALIERQKDRIGIHFEGLIEKSRKAPVKSVLATLLKDYAQTAHDHPKIFRMFWMTPKSDQGEDIESLRHLEPIFDKLTELIKLGIEKGEFLKKNPRLAAVTVLTIANSPLILNLCGKMPMDVSCDALIQEIQKAAFAYLNA
jgi:AcrR family transcriptional regulator